MQIAITFLKGHYHGAEYPPAPARLFQALANGLYDRRNISAKESVLSWLEQLPAPEIQASLAHHEYSPLVNFMPDNDDDINHVPSGGQPLTRYVLPENAVVIYRWPNVSGCPDEDALQQLLELVRCLGRTEDLVLAEGGLQDTEVAGLQHFYPSTKGTIPLLVPQKGLLKDCQRRYPRQLSKHITKRGLKKKVMYSTERPVNEAPIAIFDVTTLSGEKHLHFAPFQLRQLSGMVRGTLIAEAKALQLDKERTTRLACGHHAKGLEHFAVVPIPSIDEGWKADGRLRHVAIIGYGITDQEDQNFFDTLTTKLEGASLRQPRDPFRSNTNSGKIIGSLHRQSLQRLGYMKTFFTGKSKRFCSISPVVLQKYNDRPSRPISACLGLSKEELNEIESITPHHGPFLPTSDHPRKYLVPDYLQKLPRMHLEACFKTERSGPLLYGCGQFVGLGLMLPV